MVMADRWAPSFRSHNFKLFEESQVQCSYLGNGFQIASSNEDDGGTARLSSESLLWLRASVSGNTHVGVFRGMIAGDSDQLEGVTHHSPTPPAPLTLQIRRINTILAIFRVFSVIWRVFGIF
jgi:hypothetical protein